MGEVKSIQDYWQSLPSYEPAPAPRSTRCEEAEKFYVWCEREVGKVTPQPTSRTINYTKFFLQEQFWHFHRKLPEASHPRADHECLFHVWEEWFEKLWELSLELSPPPLHEAPPKPVAPKEREPSLPFGDEEDE